jgi:hypothetical protein
MNDAYPNTSSPVLEERAAHTAFAGASLAAQYIEDAVADSPPFAVWDVRQHEELDTAESVRDDSLADLGKVGVAKAAPVATRGFRGAISRLGFRVSPGRAERAELDQREERARDEEVIRQATWVRAASILIANPKGGVGKTPTALLLGGVLATVRGGSVCVVEVSDDAGALAYRAEGNPSLGLGELVRDVDTISTAGQLAGYTAPQTSYASVIGTVARM